MTVTTWVMDCTTLTVTKGRSQHSLREPTIYYCWFCSVFLRVPSYVDHPESFPGLLRYPSVVLRGKDPKRRETLNEREREERSLTERGPEAKGATVHHRSVEEGNPHRQGRRVPPDVSDRDQE